MARWPVRRNTLVTRSRWAPRARIWWSGWNEAGATVTHIRVLHPAEMPVDTAQLARFPISKMLMRILAEGVARSWIVETALYGIGGPTGHGDHGITPRW